MKPTDPDFQPRRDGWFEHRGRWDEVGVGTVIGTDKRSEAWEIIAQSHGPMVPTGKTLWMRARELTTGAEFTIEPKTKTALVTILTRSPEDTSTGESDEPSDADAILLVIEKLGATHLATRDDATGEITCPNYFAGYGYVEGSLRDPHIEHVRLAHGLNVSDGIPTEELITLHASAHGREAASQVGGFPHRHVPEDLSTF